MNTQKLTIEGIPALLWGETSRVLIMAIHGNKSNKADTPIRILAEQAVKRGYQVLSFDLPQHGERSQETIPCKVDQCVRELNSIFSYANTHWEALSLFANSMGAYVSLVAFSAAVFEQVLFLSPVVDMQYLISNVMSAFQITEERLRTEQEIETPIGMTLYWDYYSYVKEHPITTWASPTAILYGELDEVSERATIDAFCSRFSASLEVIQACPHYMHTPEQLSRYTCWLEKYLNTLTGTGRTQPFPHSVP